MSSSSISTFEQTVAAKANHKSPDPIHWTAETSYRSSPYRLLNHQKGLIGTVTVRLLEAKNLVRRHWSVLSLGPVKHLGLSKAHGEVSSFAQFQLGYVDYDPLVLQTQTQTQTQTQPPSLYPHFHVAPDSRIFQSSTIYSNSNPVWSSTQSSANKSLFSIPFHKGTMPLDGMNVVLQIQVKEERTAADALLPGLSGITKGGAADGQIGVGYVDLTHLLLRRDTHAGSVTPSITLSENDVWDLWVDLMYEEGILAAGPSINKPVLKDSDPTSSNSTGQIRILISYEPHGLAPRQGDIVALEAFARFRDSSIHSLPIIPPLHPLLVVDLRGDYILVQFDYQYHTERESKTKKGRVKLHRNSIFVVERTNLVDSVLNAALTPMDMALSTPLGKGISHHTQPYMEAVGELLMPAFLSTKLLWEACKLGGGATWIGIQTAVSVLIQSQDPEHRRKVQKSSSIL